MNGIDPPSSQQIATNSLCLLAPDIQPFEPQAEDILTDEDLLDLFRIVKQVLRKNPDSEKLAKLLFCMSYALGDHIKFSKPCHEDRIVFRDNHSAVHSVRLPSTSSCCVNTSSQHYHRASTSTTTFSLNHALNDSTSSMTRPEKDNVQKWIDSSSVTSTASPSPISPLIRLPSVSYLTNNQPTATTATTSTTHITNLSEISNENTSTDAYSVRPYTNFRSLYTTSASPGANHTSSPTITTSSITTTTAAAASMHSPIVNRNSPSIPSPSASHHVPQQSVVEVSDLSLVNPDSSSNTTPDRYNQANNTIQHPTNTEVVMEPQQRGFYYQDGRIAREPVLLQRYAEQGILTQASLMRKRKRHSADANSPYEVSNLPTPTKKPKIPHRHGEFEQRRDDIINRMRSITMADLEQKAQRLPNQFTLAIDESVTLAENNLSATVENGSLSQEQHVELLEPALRILTNHSNMKPHLDNGMNQNGIYYNSDYFRLYLAFEQFQRTFAILFPNEIMKVPETSGIGNTDSDASGTASNTTITTTAAAAATERDKDRERNANMKAYRVWIEPLLTETNWAAFRRNIVVGERMMQLTKLVGQGVLLMTKELSGSKLHLTFTNSEWDEFINGLESGRWDQTIEWENSQKKQLGNTKSLLVSELRLKFATHYWFYPHGSMVSSKERRLEIHASTVTNNNNNNNNNNMLLHRNSMDPSNLMHNHHQQHLHTHH